MSDNKSTMEKLSNERKAQVLRCLVEGNSIASTVRITGTAKMTVLKILAQAGEACSVYHDEHMVNLPCKRVQMDEVWSFVGCKEARKKTAKRKDHVGDIWTWTAICADTKVIAAWFVGDRGGQSAVNICEDLAPRFAGRVQITSDGHQAYPWAVRSAFGEAEVDFAQLVKVYAKGKDGRDYVTRVEKARVYGNPDMEKVSTSYVERSNLTLRMSNKRFARLTPCHSKKLANHVHMLAIGFLAYNFCKVHGALKKTPAMAAGIADHVWSMEEVIAMVNAYQKEQEDMAFENAFEAKYSKPREFPKTYAPAPKEQIPLPWYLDMTKDGPPEKGLTD